MTPSHAIPAEPTPPGGRAPARPKIGRAPLVWQDAPPASVEQEPVATEETAAEETLSSAFSKNRIRAWEPRFALLLLAVVIITNAWMHSLLQNDAISIRRISPMETSGLGGTFLVSPDSTPPISPTLPLLARDAQ